jgi:hypothetical protein
MLLAMIDAAAKIYPKAVYTVHLDHGNEEHAFDAIASNKYNSVMIDASHDPFEINVERTKSVVLKAHENNVLVEAELGVLSGVEDDISVDEKSASNRKPGELPFLRTRAVGHICLSWQQAKTLGISIESRRQAGKHLQTGVYLAVVGTLDQPVGGRAGTCNGLYISFNNCQTMARWTVIYCR